MRGRDVSANGVTRGGGVLPYVGYGFSAVLVINRVSILADFGHFDHK